jgi:hypothetical protein
MSCLTLIIVFFLIPTMIASLPTTLGARSIIAYAHDKTAVANAALKSFSLDSSPHELDCQPNGDDCDR